MFFTKHKLEYFFKIKIHLVEVKINVTQSDQRLESSKLCGKILFVDFSTINEKTLYDEVIKKKIKLKIILITEKIKTGRRRSFL